MPSNLVRITLDKKTASFTVEYGDRQQPGLTAGEEEEFEQLNEELIEYSDFTVAEKLEDEARQQLMEKKKRLEELAEKKIREHIDWYPIEEDLIETLLIVCGPETRHTYVENLPSYLLDRILDPKFTLNISYPPQGEPMRPTPEKDEGPSHPRADGHLEGVTANELKVIKVVSSANPNWTDYVSIKEEDGVVYVRPHKYLDDAWGPINVALKQAYGDTWKSRGKGDKQAHWRIEF